MNIANRLTVLRVILIPVFIFVLMYDKLPEWTKWIALGIYVFACLTDFADGLIARKKNLITNFGKFMDPIADKLLVCSALICLLSLRRINLYLVLIIIAREFIINGFRLIASDRGVVIAANKWGKVKTTFQMVMIGFLIANLESIHIVDIILAWIVLFLTVFSLFDYIFKNYKVLLEDKKEDK